MRVEQSDGETESIRDIPRRSRIPFLSRALAGATASGASVAVASLYPETELSLALSWLAALALIWFLPRSRRPIFDCFAMGMVFHLIAFPWITHTIVYFGGFPPFIGFLLFLLFCVVSSIQFLFCGWLYKRLDHPLLERWCLRVASAWFVSEFLVPRLFPWAFAHSQVVWGSFAALAEVIGVIPIGFVMLWWAAVIGRTLLPKVFLVSGEHQRPSRGVRTAVYLSVAVILIGGAIRNREVMHATLTAPKLRIGVVQGNVEAKKKRDMAYLEANLEQYRSLSRETVGQGAQLVLWPESVMNAWTPEGESSVLNTTLDPIPDLDAAVIYGGLSFRKRPQSDIEAILRQYRNKVSDRELESMIVKKFVAAIGVDNRRTIVGRYYKRVLMPFGEFMPFAETIPFLKKISPQTGDFTIGDLKDPITFHLRDTQGAEQKVPIAALVCYEDLVPSMSREAVLGGAKLLVNLTNDGWFGDTSAPHQHHLLAQWRAIETRRTLVRATNTGLTAIVDPFARTTASLPVFSSGILVNDVPLLTGTTVYTWVGDLPAWVLSVFLLLLTLRRRKPA